MTYIERLREELHYCKGTCDLAIRQRGEAEAEIERLTSINRAMLHYLETALKAKAVDDTTMHFQAFLPLEECLKRWRNDEQKEDR